ncbi:MAG: tetratricopeptide repeat protein [Bacteroidales bacterium]|nr:tetratricopeptide repeat protein [Bacteroidales bacterium]MBQ6101243.1 tetratricopeptide repeat protein [Bacteroidales bacterium]
MLRNHRLFVPIALTALMLLLVGCSTKKNTFTRRVFHNLTSHYNVYWNGEYSLKEGDNQLKQNVKDDYTKMLRVYNYGTKANAMSLNSQMDRALQKTSVCVQKHSMKFNGKERVRWIDDAYLVMAKAHFFKQDYIPAKRTFEFVSTEYYYNDIALVSNMWLVKLYIETQQYSKAIAMIEQLQAKSAGVKKLPKEFYRNFELTVADYYIAIKDYRKAIDYLKSGMLHTNDRDMQTRCMFILGQIYAELGDSKHATEWFKKVTRRDPPYEMLFEAKMSMARMGSSGNAKELYKMLNKMLNETKNEEYIDRIYFAMAELALREGDVNKAIGFYGESVAAATSNNAQRANSALKVAAILFDRNEYELAQAYYDTAVMALDKNTYVGYDSILNISNTLNDLVLNLTVIRDQDSLLRVADMDSVSRIKLIDQIIADVIEQEQIEKERQEYEEQMALMGGAVGNTSVTDDGTKGGSWYFYNATALRNGFSDFSKKWGMRKLEDNWRISDKRNINSGGLSDDFGGGGFDSDDEEENDTISENLTNHDRGFYLVDLPFTEEQKEEAHRRIAEALYNVGFIYFNQLSDYPRSIDAYEDLDTRYPGNENELPAWYALYKMNKDIGNMDKSDDYKNRILSKYPESSYAKFILDPNYYKTLNENATQASALYTKTYEAYQQGQYYRVRMNAERALDLYATDTAFAPRFALLDAIARGRLETVDTMAYALLNVVRSYPGSSIRGYAMTLLENINEEYHLGIDLAGMIDSKGGVIEEKPKSPYVYSPDSKHLVVIVFNPKKVRTEPLKVRITDFNKKEYRFKNFEMRNLMFGEEKMLVSLSEFENEKEAKDYITSMFLTDYVFGGLDKNEYSVLPISVDNYGAFYKEKKVDEYKAFLEENSK